MTKNNLCGRKLKQRKARHEDTGRRIPDRWLNYDPVGRDLRGTRFVPFKTPLDRSFFRGKQWRGELFDVDRIIAFAHQAGKTIGMVIDLTNTDKYYDKTEWGDHGVKYIKMKCPGHEVSEREDIVRRFVSSVDEFINDSRNGDKLIGVHCTHGLNRTGYLICRYLIDRMGWTAERAISEFEFSRGHPIERAHYKRSLYEAEKRILKKMTCPRHTRSLADCAALIECPYSRAHHISPAAFPEHLRSCRMKYLKMNPQNKEIRCRVDPRHLVLDVELAFHEKHCDDVYFRKINDELVESSSSTESCSIDSGVSSGSSSCSSTTSGSEEELLYQPNHTFDV